ncbi:glucose-6-phosphate dehydrogenase [Buchnera aphidicola]|uniref:glucose-6-phosphate dehydrogenase n=1 Tax=Buchnera aphidicola TaxID=9 RepID=UPI00346423C3
MKNNIIQPYDIVIFGAKGDLSCKKLIPALYELEQKKLLHDKTRIIGVGRAEWNHSDYINKTCSLLKNLYLQKINLKSLNILKKRLLFCNLDVTNIQNFSQLRKILSQTLSIKIYYFAVPPNTFNSICSGLGKIKFNHHPNRIIVEKPIGTSLSSCKNIHHKLGIYFQEKQIFRIDHYLGKETILNLLILRFANPLFYHIWSYKYIKCVKITVEEKVGIEGRWEYFDNIGQTRDMIQNHLLQILSLLTMSIPKELKSKYIRKEKIKILKSLRSINSENIHIDTIRGQYTSGIVDDKNVPGYLEELGSKKSSNTETFVSIKTYIDHPIWKNVPFYLKTGKRLSEKKSEIIIYLNHIPNSIFNINKINMCNILKIKLQPNEGLEIQFLNKTPDINNKYQFQPTHLKFNYTDIFQKNITDAYERLLLEVMKNDQSLFVSREEIEASWTWIDSIINLWNKHKIHPTLYPSGTCGPKLYKNQDKNYHTK